MHTFLEWKSEKISSACFQRFSCKQNHNNLHKKDESKSHINYHRLKFIKLGENIGQNPKTHTNVLANLCLFLYLKRDELYKEKSQTIYFVRNLLQCVQIFAEITRHRWHDLNVKFYWIFEFKNNYTITSLKLSNTPPFSPCFELQPQPNNLIMI